MKTAIYQLGDLTCPSCIKGIEATMKKQPGVNEVKVIFNSSKVKVSYNELTGDGVQYQEILEKLGYPVLSTKVKSA